MVKLKVVHIEVTRKHFEPGHDAEDFVYRLSLMEELVSSGCVRCSENSSANNINREFECSLTKTSSRNAVQDVKVKGKVHDDHEVQGDFESPILLEFLLSLFANVFVISGQ